MLRAHYNAERQALSAAELAAAVGMKNYVAANTHYGKFARQLCGLLGYEPPEADKNNDARWTYVLATYPGDRNATGDHLWFLRSEVAQALEDMGLVRKRLVDDPVGDIELRHTSRKRPRSDDPCPARARRVPRQACAVLGQLCGDRVCDVAIAGSVPCEAVA